MTKDKKNENVWDALDMTKEQYKKITDPLELEINRLYYDTKTVLDLATALREMYEKIPDKTTEKQFFWHFVASSVNRVADMQIKLRVLKNLDLD